MSFLLAAGLPVGPNVASLRAKHLLVHCVTSREPAIENNSRFSSPFSLQLFSSSNLYRRSGGAGDIEEKALLKDPADLRKVRQQGRD